MSTISLYELQEDGCVAKVIVQSLEGGIYTVDVETGGARYHVTDNSHKPLQFHSLTEAKQCMQGIACEQAVMTQYAAYDEMIGSPPLDHVNGNEMVIPLTNFS